MKINNYPTLFPGSSVSKKMATEELNKILLQSLSNEWTKQAYLQGWDLEVIIYKDTCKMFERMEIAEKFYKCGNTSKNTNRAETNRVSHGSKCKVG